MLSCTIKIPSCLGFCILGRCLICLFCTEYPNPVPHKRINKASPKASTESIGWYEQFLVMHPFAKVNVSVTGSCTHQTSSSSPVSITLSTIQSIFLRILNRSLCLFFRKNSGKRSSVFIDSLYSGFSDPSNGLNCLINFISSV